MLWLVQFQPLIVDYFFWKQTDPSCRKCSKSLKILPYRKCSKSLKILSKILKSRGNLCEKRSNRGSRARGFLNRSYYDHFFSDFQGFSRILETVKEIYGEKRSNVAAEQGDFDRTRVGT